MARWRIPQVIEENKIRRIKRIGWLVSEVGWGSWDVAKVPA
jgi:hypothetical protein